MIFTDLLNQKNKLVFPELRKLVDMAHANQTHPGDLLLISENGSYEYDPPILNGEQMAPFLLGPGKEGLSFHTHSDFIKRFIDDNIITDSTYEEYRSRLTYSEERKEEINNLQEAEAHSIQLEMLVYLKIWESDAFIKRLYQLVQLMKGKDYDWHFKILEHEKEEGVHYTDKRDPLIRSKIRESIKTAGLTNLYDAIKSGYVTQIRNAIAHSQFHILGTGIVLNNYKKGSKGSPFPAITFDDWTHMFHSSLIVYVCLGHQMNRISQLYSELAALTGNIMEVRAKRLVITKVEKKVEIKAGEEIKVQEVKKFKSETKYLTFRPEVNRWNWYAD
jgi:hypothetical protein